jgi:uncharacterized protein YdhG (YjbR/CyaY superfamily)
MNVSFATIDEYIKAQPKEIALLLEKIRQIVKKSAPESEETISYGIPTFKFYGILVHFAAFKNHIGFYALPSGNEQFKDELSRYKIGKGSVQFPLDQPIPFDLISKIVHFRVKENVSKKKK